VLCQKLCQHPLPKVILLPADKHSNARRFRYLTPRKRAPRSVFASNDTLPDATREALLKAFDEGKDFTSTDVGQ
jgi:hypothetical protein